MQSWPNNWTDLALATAGIPVTDNTKAVMRAWQASTPLPPLSNNPIGMPKGTSGAPSYLNTAYAIFPSMEAFYAAFRGLISSHVGAQLVLAITGKTPFPSTWRSIQSLGFPGMKTETDYPSALLDLASQSFRNKVQATPRAQRKTSGVIGDNSADKAAVLAGMAAVNEAVQQSMSIRDAIRHVTTRVG